MSKGDTTETDVLNYVFKATAFPWNAISNLYIGLHTQDPGEAGVQTTYEATYGGYLRVAVVRTAAGWTVSGNSVTNASVITFPICSGGTSTVTYISVGTVASPDAGQILYSGALASSLVVSAGITPQFGAGALVISED